MVLQDGHIIFGLRNSLKPGTLEVVDLSDLVNVLAHQVVHDDHCEGLHELDLDVEDAVEAGEHRLGVLVDVLLVLVENIPLPEHLQLLRLQRLYHELLVSGEEEEAARLAAALLELRHLDVVRAGCERVEQVVQVEARVLPDLPQILRTVLLYLNSHLLLVCHV